MRVEPSCDMSSFNLQRVSQYFKRRSTEYNYCIEKSLDWDNYPQPLITQGEETQIRGQPSKVVRGNRSRGGTEPARRPRQRKDGAGGQKRREKSGDRERSRGQLRERACL